MSVFCLSGSKSSVAKNELDWAASHGHDNSNETVEGSSSDELFDHTKDKMKGRKQTRKRNHKKVWHLSQGMWNVLD